MVVFFQCIKNQALTILGSVDFLGNPVGLFNDMASGVTGLITTSPDVVGLVRDVAHGVTDTTSKVCTSSCACALCTQYTCVHYIQCVHSIHVYIIYSVYTVYIWELVACFVCMLDHV